MIALVSCQASSLLYIDNYANGWGQFPVTMQEMATKFGAREVLVLATVLVGLIARLMELSKLIAERPGLAQKAWKTSEPL